MHVAARGSWTAPPERVHRYRLRDRRRDSRYGRADGRKGIPPVTLSPSAADPAEASTEAPPTVVTDPEPEDRATEGEVATDALPEAVAPAVPLTPYLHTLGHERDLALKAEEARWYQDPCPQLRVRLREAELSRETSAIKMGLAADRLELVPAELTEDELNRRSAAEQDEKEWPEERVRHRRRQQRQLARFEAEEAMRKSTADVREAEVTMQHARRAFDDGLRAAQAVGWQIVHHYGRREATYLRSLVRKHPDGPELVRLLELTGPDLPEWLLIDAKALIDGP
jgi:hypothetical protein